MALHRLLQPLDRKQRLLMQSMQTITKCIFCRWSCFN